MPKIENKPEELILTIEQTQSDTSSMDTHLLSIDLDVGSMKRKY